MPRIYSIPCNHLLTRPDMLREITLNTIHTVIRYLDPLQPWYIAHNSQAPSVHQQNPSSDTFNFLGRIAVLRTQMRPILTDRVAWSVGLSVTLVSHAKMAAPIRLPFGLRTWVGPGTMYQMGSRSPIGRGNFFGENGRPIVKYRDTLRSSVQRRLNRQGCRLGYGHGQAVGIMYWMGVHRC